MGDLGALPADAEGIKSYGGVSPAGRLSTKSNGEEVGHGEIDYGPAEIRGFGVEIADVTVDDGIWGSPCSNAGIVPEGVKCCAVLGFVSKVDGSIMALAGNGVPVGYLTICVGELAANGGGDGLYG